MDKKVADDFYAGVCVALQIVTDMDNSVIWDQIVDSVGADKISHYAKVTEPDEWEIAGFSKYWKQFGGRAGEK
jgi:hypothetical protein